MFYSANGNFFIKKKIYEYFKPTKEDLEKIESYKTNIKYSNLDTDIKKSLDSLINFTVQEANNLIKKYSVIKNENERKVEKDKIYNILKNEKNTNTIIRILKRMVQIHKGTEKYLDSLYYNKESLFNNIIQVKNWEELNEDNIPNVACEKLKTKLSMYFDNYNKGKAEKDKADLNIIAAQKQKLAAQNQKNISIININKAATNYNKTLIQLKLQNCN